MIVQCFGGFSLLSFDSWKGALFYLLSYICIKCTLLFVEAMLKFLSCL